MRLDWNSSCFIGRPRVRFSYVESYAVRQLQINKLLDPRRRPTFCARRRSAAGRLLEPTVSQLWILSIPLVHTMQ
ncbi:unnamed protein product [Calypogeia fissa]